MNENTCVCCGKEIPEGGQVCWKCERAITKVGTILQSYNATEEDVIKAYGFLNKQKRKDRNK